MNGKADWFDLGPADELGKTALQRVNARNIALALSFKDGRFGAVSNVCNHAGGPLGEGQIEGDYLACPWHHWKFHRITGKGEPGFEEDCVHWHRTAKAACDPFGADLYAELKRACDAYFFLTHRAEARGIGGIFFDDWTRGGFERSLAFVRSVGDHFLAAYEPIFHRRCEMRYGERERDFQAYRRGRYVEFNLVYDRGTLFGLQSGGRAESILMSLPPSVKWRYDWKPEAGSAEAKLYTDFLVAKDWV